MNAIRYKVSTYKINKYGNVECAKKQQFDQRAEKNQRPPCVFTTAGKSRIMRQASAKPLIELCTSLVKMNSY